MEDWSKLTTVNYPHGMGGNFFTCLITNTPIVLSSGLTVDYHSPGVPSMFGFKNPDIQVGCELFEEYRTYWIEEETDDRFTRRQRNFNKMVTSESFEDFKKNIIDEYRGYMRHNQNVETAWAPHYAYGNQKYLSCQDIFPGSRNICLQLENESNRKVFDFIFKSKAIGHWGHKRLYNFYSGRRLEANHDEKVYYIDRILFEPDYLYITRIEDELKVKINREDVRNYRRAHYFLLARNGLKYQTMDHWRDGRLELE